MQRFLNKGLETGFLRREFATSFIKRCLVIVMASGITVSSICAWNMKLIIYLIKILEPFIQCTAICLWGLISGEANGQYIRLCAKYCSVCRASGMVFAVSASFGRLMSRFMSVSRYVWSPVIFSGFKWILVSKILAEICWANLVLIRISSLVPWVLHGTKVRLPQICKRASSYKNGCTKWEYEEHWYLHILFVVGRCYVCSFLMSYC